MGPTGFPTKMLNGMATTKRRQKTMCSCIECVGDHPEPTPEEIAAYEAREKTAGRAVEASPSRLLIIGSNTLGPESLTSEGFDWVFAPLDVATKLAKHLPHVTLAFDNDCFDADALASRMIQLLQQITPIWFQTDDAAASTPNQHTKELL